MRKKICALFSAVLLWTACLPMAIPAASGETNLFLNADFEKLTQKDGRTIAENWGFWDAYWTDISSESPHSGSTCIMIQNLENNRNPRITQILGTVVPGDVYSAGYYIRASKKLGGSGGFSFRFVYYDTDGNEMTAVSGKTLTSFPSDAWTEYKQTFTVPEGADSLRVDLQLNGAGIVYIDDVFFIHTEKGSAFSIDSNAVFYYSDSVSLVEIEVTDAGGEGTAAVFALLKGEKTVQEAVTKDFVGRKAIFSFPVSTLTSFLEPYTVSVTVLKSTGNTEKLTREIYKVKRPSRLSKDGIYYKKDGTPFVPIIGYHVDVPGDLVLPSQDHFAKCKQIGINVITLSYWYSDYNYFETRMKPTLEKAKEYGLMVLVALYRGMLPGGHEYNLENTKKVVNALADHEAVFAFTLMDEPLLHDRVSAEFTMLPGYLAVRSLNDSIPVLTVDHRSSLRDYKRIANYCDIVMSDAYPTTAAASGGQFSYVKNNVSLARKAASMGERTVYSLVQAFNWEEYGYFPTASETLHFVYQSLFAGAQGIGYFAISDADTDSDGNTIPLFKTDRWAELQERCNREIPIALSHFIENKGRNATDLSGDGYSARHWKSRDEEYILLINEENAEKAVEFPVAQAFFFAAPYGRDITCGGTDGILRYTLAAGEAVLLTLSDEKVMRIFTADDMPAEELLPGEEMRLEVLMPPSESVQKLSLALYQTQTGKTELLNLYILENPASKVLNTVHKSFAVPDAEGLSWKLFWWNGLAPMVE